ncbi:MAG: 50S ribosomal protein L10 [Verrucomicrobia bacterium]|nr:MAG: 50S ribosomal protein L10 [Verrucomicrobiota bacterium]
MRNEKKYLVKEAVNYLEKSNYVFLVNFERTTVKDVAELRKGLSKVGGEFHVLKNSTLKHAAKELSLPELDQVLEGHTAVVVGGDSPAEVAKILVKFHKDKEEKCPIKIGVLDEKLLSREEVMELSKLPSLEVLRSQFLGLLNAPGTQMVRVLQAVPEGILNVLQAKAKKE